MNDHPDKIPSQFRNALSIAALGVPTGIGALFLGDFLGRPLPMAALLTFWVVSWFLLSVLVMSYEANRPGHINRS